MALTFHTKATPLEELPDWFREKRAEEMRREQQARDEEAAKQAHRERLRQNAEDRRMVRLARRRELEEDVKRARGLLGSTPDEATALRDGDLDGLARRMAAERVVAFAERQLTHHDRGETV